MAARKEEELKVVAATSKQTFAVFRFTQIDVRNLNPILTVNQASDLMDQLVSLSSSKKSGEITKGQYEGAINNFRTELIKKGGEDKRSESSRKEQFSMEPERRFTLSVAQ